MMDTEKQRQCRCDDTRLTKSRNARSEQLLVELTESLTNWEWLPGELDQNMEGPAGFRYEISDLQTSQLTILVCSESLRYLIHTKFRCSSTVTSSYYINKRQNMAWRKLIINNRQKKVETRVMLNTQLVHGLSAILELHVQPVRGQKFTRDINFIRPLTQDGHGTTRVRTIGEL